MHTTPAVRRTRSEAEHAFRTHAPAHATPRPHRPVHRRTRASASGILRAHTTNRTSLLSIIAVLAVLITGGLPQNAWAQPDGPSHPVRVSARLIDEAGSETSTLATAPLRVEVTIDHDDGWHTYPIEKIGPAELIEFLVATSITVTAEGSAAPAIGVGKPVAPPAAMIDVPEAFGGQGTYGVFEGRTVITVPVALSPSVTANGTATLSVTVTHQACDDSICLPPQEDAFAFDLVVRSATPSTGSQAGMPPADRRIDTTTDSPVGTGITATDGSAPATAAPGAGEASAGDTGRTDSPNLAPSLRLLGLIPIPPADSLAGIAVITLLAALGGFILNLTPCVLPVLPLKIMAISQHASTPGRSLTLGLAMAVGVVLFWVGIGIPAVLFSSFSDPSRIFSLWYVTLGIGLVIMVMSLGLFGLFELRLPSAVYSVDAQADSVPGAIGFGVMTAVLGLPCFGLVAGGLLAATAAAPWAATLSVFTGIGVGMAAPYLVLSMKPGWVSRIPRTGPASTLVKQVMGLLLLAAGGYFAAIGLKTLVAGSPYLGAVMHWWAVAIFVAAAGVWLIARVVVVSKSGIARGIFVPFGLLLTAAAAWLAISETGNAREQFDRRQQAEALADQAERDRVTRLEAAVRGGVSTGSAAGDADAAELLTPRFATDYWLDFEPGLVERAAAAGYVVVLDFTADWCVNCKALERAVLNVDPVRSRLEADDVVMVKADLTSTSAPGWAFLKERLGRTGIPTLAVYAPGNGLEPVWIDNTYTADVVINAIRRAIELGLGGERLSRR